MSERSAGFIDSFFLKRSLPPLGFLSPSHLPKSTAGRIYADETRRTLCTAWFGVEVKALHKKNYHECSRSASNTAAIESGGRRSDTSWHSIRN